MDGSGSASRLELSGQSPLCKVKSCFQLRDDELLTGNQPIRNSRDSLERAAIQIQSKKPKFVDTFAPVGHKPDKTLDLQLVLILLTIPSATRGTMFWKGGMKNLDAFASSVKHDAFKDTSKAMVTASYQIGRQFVAKAACTTSPPEFDFPRPWPHSPTQVTR